MPPTNRNRPKAFPCPDSPEPTPLFFYMPDATYGEFCQWNNETFNCAEQFMMYCKAARFHDVDRQAQVLASKSPKEQKRLGKLTVNFKDESWDQIKSQVVEAGNRAKFGQNEDLKQKLLATEDRMLCEAASRDRVWGVGYNAKRAMDFRKHWGENQLGKALMAVRDRIRSEEEEAKRRGHWSYWEES